MSFEILAHRGLWQKAEEKNTLPALLNALKNQFGVETDVRDMHGVLVIAHDPPAPDTNPLLLEDFLKNYAELGCEQTLALNIKADGLCEQILQMLQAQAISVERVFFFDMSVPDMLFYQRMGAPFYTRVSDVEPLPVLLKESKGLWVDAFANEWIQAEHLQHWFAAGKRVALVSPELHGRPHEQVWQQWKLMLDGTNEQGVCMLCTDYPEAARDFFHV